MPSMTPAEVTAIFKGAFGRDPESEDVVTGFCNSGLTLEEMIRSVILSEEFSSKWNNKLFTHKTPDEFGRHNTYNFLSPNDLRPEIPLPPRILLVGTCFLDRWGEVLDDLNLGIKIDRLHFDMHPNVQPPFDWTEYRFQIAQFPLRHFFPDSYYLKWLSSGYDETRSKELFDRIKNSLHKFVDRCCLWSNRFPVFIVNFLSPMQSVNGRLFVRSDLRDARYFVRQLNQELEFYVKTHPNAFILDADECAAIIGRRYIQEDGINIMTHGGLLTDGDFSLDQDRLTKVPPVSKHYHLKEEEFIHTLYREADAMYHSLLGAGAVKMLCVDLDDTLWRGVLAERDYYDPIQARAGWPEGIIEALAALKRRGILLCMLSKNSEDIVEKIWSDVYGSLFSLEEFAIKKINWRPKIDNLREALAEANILPNSVVFLDDNPVERAEIAAAFPEVRTISSSHYYWKRILMWSAETQGVSITNESTRRTEMVKAQIERETVRSSMSHLEFLRSLDLRVTFSRIAGKDDARFMRVMELINKTNQFNTTGGRWTADELHRICAGGIVLSADVHDRFTGYGLVAVALCADGVVEQVVMSCRVIGMDVELAMISRLTDIVLADRPVVEAAMVETKSNLLSRDLFQRSGWSLDDGVWRTCKPTQMPRHIRVE